jgi:hypothetical protein
LLVSVISKKIPAAHSPKFAFNLNENDEAGTDPMSKFYARFDKPQRSETMKLLDSN